MEGSGKKVHHFNTVRDVASDLRANLNLRAELVSPAQLRHAEMGGILGWGRGWGLPAGHSCHSHPRGMSERCFCL